MSCCFQCPYGQIFVLAAEDWFLGCESCRQAEVCRMLLGITRLLIPVQPSRKTLLLKVPGGSAPLPRKKHLDLSNGPLGQIVGDPQYRAALVALEAIEAAKSQL